VCLEQVTSAAKERIMPQAIQFVLNGRPSEIDVDPRRPLLWVLRTDLGLTGTKYGCGERECGACTVLLDGRPVFACRTPVRSVQGREVTTVEGLEKDGKLHPVQQAFADHVEETERPDGLYDEMSQEASHVAARASRLRADHPAITAALAESRQRLGEPLGSEADVDAVRDDLQRLMGRIVRHRQGGADLVWEAYAIDIGGAG